MRPYPFPKPRGLYDHRRYRGEQVGDLREWRPYMEPTLVQGRLRRYTRCRPWAPDFGISAFGRWDGPQGSVRCEPRN